MPKTKFVDFKAVKAALNMEQVLSHYGILERFKRSGDTLSGPCPIHKGENPTQFRVSISKNVWNCFSECKHGGNVLDFVARMEGVSIHAAALKAIEWFHLDPEAVSGDSRRSEADEGEAQGEAEEVPKSAGKASAKEASKPKASPKPENATPNPPLKFKLEKLDTKHPYFAERGILPEAIEEFGLGFFTGEKGIMTGRIVIPIHNARGELVAYAGRTPGEPPKDAPKYKLPPGFRKSQELFNIHRAEKEPPEKPLIVVEGFFDVIKLYQLGYGKAVALMGSSMSATQEKLIFEATTPQSQIIVMLDEDEAGRAARDDIALRLSRFCFTKINSFAKEGVQPEHLDSADLTEILGGGQ